MDRILILMDAPEYVDAKGAIESARRHAAHPEALSWGLILQEYPEGDSYDALEALKAYIITQPEGDLWTEMSSFWAGEGYVLLANPAMRFTPGWDRALLKTLRKCSASPVLTCALTGYLPVREDPVGEVCPVAADAFQKDGGLSFQHGMPLRHANSPVPGPFLHPDFCFAPAGFFRALAQQEGDDPLFLRAFRAGWELYTLHEPIIRLQWEIPVEPAYVPIDHELLDAFDKRFGVSFPSRLLSPQSRRGMLHAEVDRPKKYPLKLRLRESWRHRKHALKQLMSKHNRKLKPQGVTLFTAEMPEETLMWFRQLARLKNLALTAYVPALLKRQVVEFLPDAYDLHPQHAMELPGQRMEALLPLSKAALLSAARDRILTPSHYIWMDPDCVRYPVYEGAFLDWAPICTDKIVMAMVAGQPDTSIFSVPQGMVLNLATDLQARTLAILTQRGELPSEEEVWNLVIRENPDWFSLVVLPVRGQLFTQICQA